jgi:hypothetical protein
MWEGRKIAYRQWRSHQRGQSEVPKHDGNGIRGGKFVIRRCYRGRSYFGLWWKWVRRVKPRLLLKTHV